MRTWNRIDDGVLPYLLAALRATWIWTLLWLWTRLIVPPRPDLASPLMVFLLLGVSTLVAQVASFWFQGVRGAVLVVSGGLIAVLVTLLSLFGFRLTEDIFATLTLLLVATWCWRWGILAGSELLAFDAYLANFVYGVLAVAFGVMVTVLAHANLLREFVFLILLYFAIGLVTLALASLREAQTSEGKVVALSRYWLGTVGTVVGILLVVGFVIGSIFDPAWARQVLNVLAAIYHAFVQVFLLVALVIAYVLVSIFEFLGSLFHITSIDINLPDLGAILRLIQLAPQDPDSLSEIPSWLYILAQIGAVVVIVSILVALFAFAFRRFQRRRDEKLGETHESVFSIELLRDQLRKLFRRDAAPPPVIAPFVEIQGDEPGAQIRRIYQQLLALGADRGVKRRPGQTPSEYERALKISLRLENESLGIITGAYLRARYDTAPLTNKDVERVARAWEDLTAQFTV